MDSGQHPGDWAELKANDPRGRVKSSEESWKISTQKIAEVWEPWLWELCVEPSFPPAQDTGGVNLGCPFPTRPLALFTVCPSRGKLQTHRSLPHTSSVLRLPLYSRGTRRQGLTSGSQGIQTNSFWDGCYRTQQRCAHCGGNQEKKNQTRSSGDGRLSGGIGLELGFGG